VYGSKDPRVWSLDKFKRNVNLMMANIEAEICS
jgi:hypothetical protein